MSTKLKFNILFICSLIAFGIIVEYSAIIIFKKNFLQQRKIFGETILDSIKQDLNFSVAIANPEYFKKVTDNILKVKYVNFFKIYRADKLIFANIKKKDAPIIIEKIEILPVSIHPQAVKYVMGLNISDFKVAQEKFIKNISLTIILLIFIIYLIISFLINKFLSPINYLVEAVKKLKSGEYKKLNIKFSKEFYLLIETYNNFVENLQKKDEQLQNKIIELNNKITEIKALQKVIINTEKLASIGTMAAGMAHEINNPLAGIKGQAEIMLYIEDIKDSSLRKTFENIVVNCDRIADIIKRLKGFSKIIEEKNYYKIKDLINDAIDILTQSKKIGKDIEFKGNFSKTDTELYCNRNEIIQVFINLIENSYQACNKNCEIDIDVYKFEDRIEIYFKDNGKGIDKKIKNKIFDPFFTTKKEEGTGLGMYICHKIVNDNNGKIELIDSETGACFKLTFIKDKGAKR